MKTDFLKMTPLHIIAGNPSKNLQCIECVYYAYPEAFDKKCVGGMLPIHIAFYNKDMPDDVMMFFIKKYNHICLEGDNSDIDDTNYLPIHILCERFSNEITSSYEKKKGILKKLALMRKDYGLSSLQIVIEKNLFSWENGMKLLFESNPNDLEMIDPKTKLSFYVICSDM